MALAYRKINLMNAHKGAKYVNHRFNDPWNVDSMDNGKQARLSK